MSFTPTKLNVIRRDIEKALVSVASKHGVKFDLGNCTYSADNFKIKLGAAKVNASGNAITKEASSYQTLATSYGLDPKLLFKNVKFSSGEVFKITGLNTRAYKYPVCAEDMSGNCYKLPVSMVKTGKVVK